MQGADYSWVPLWRRDGSIAAHALVDNGDLRLVEGYRWHVGSNGYARCNLNRVPILMHRLLMGLAPGDARQADHISRDRLDNRRENLRVASRDENMQNRPSHRGSTSRFRGVHWDATKDHWEAAARVDNRKHRLGYFHDETEAAFAAEAWRRIHMPFATPDPEVERLIALVHDLAA